MLNMPWGYNLKIPRKRDTPRTNNLISPTQKMQEMKELGEAEMNIFLKLRRLKAVRENWRTHTHTQSQVG